MQNRPNLTVISDVLVDRIEFDDLTETPTATGIKVQHADGSNQQFKAVNEVILSAGSIGSPQLLQLSGIGDSAFLSKRNIASRVDLPGVGGKSSRSFAGS